MTDPLTLVDRCLPCRPRRRGFTLTEMVIAVPSIAVLMLGMAAAIKTAGRAVPDGNSISSTTVLTGRVMDLLAADITYATAIDKMTATELVITVADRDGNSLPETIRYAWSGVAGAPLTRQLKSDAVPPITWTSVPATSIAASVQEFAFEYDKRSSSAPTTYSSGPEVLLASANSSSSTDDYAITSTNFVGQYVVPILPSNAKSWRVTKVALRLRISGLLNTGQAMAQIRTARNRLPTSTVLDETLINENQLALTYGFKTFTFANCPNIAPADGVCLVLQWLAGTYACDVEYSNNNSAYSNYIASSDGGATWIADSSESLRFSIYGTIETPNAPALRYALANVRCQLRTSVDPATRISTYIRVLNEPQVAGP